MFINVKNFWKHNTCTRKLFNLSFKANFRPEIQGGGEFFLTVIFPTFYISFLLCATPPPPSPNPLFPGAVWGDPNFSDKKTGNFCPVCKIVTKILIYNCLIIDDTFLYDNLVLKHFYCSSGTNTYTLYRR